MCVCSSAVWSTGEYIRETGACSRCVCANIFGCLSRHGVQQNACTALWSTMYNPLYRSRDCIVACIDDCCMHRWISVLSTFTRLALGALLLYVSDITHRSLLLMEWLRSEHSRNVLTVMEWRAQPLRQPPHPPRHPAVHLLDTAAPQGPCPPTGSPPAPGLEGHWPASCRPWPSIKFSIVPVRHAHVRIPAHVFPCTGEPCSLLLIRLGLATTLIMLPGDFSPADIR